MQAKDCPERPILELLAANPRWHTHYHGGGSMPSVLPAFPVYTPQKVVLAKMASLYKRGLVNGCPCGCRGDWEITPKGLAFLEPLTAHPDVSTLLP